MNIFVTDKNPVFSAQVLPDKHVVKMAVESCQLLAIAYDRLGWVALIKKDGLPYTIPKAHSNHPCALWVCENTNHVAWVVIHGLALCREYTFRYEKRFSCQDTLTEAENTFYEMLGIWPCDADLPEYFVDVVDPEIQELDLSVYAKYKKHLNSKPWIASNYLR